MLSTSISKAALKTLATGVLAMSMVLSFAAPAFAAEPEIVPMNDHKNRTFPSFLILLTTSRMKPLGRRNKITPIRILLRSTIRFLLVGSLFRRRLRAFWGHPPKPAKANIVSTITTSTASVTMQYRTWLANRFALLGVTRTWHTPMAM